jgi:glycine/D-amino acid oxidase-like deaminating enzyme
VTNGPKPDVLIIGAGIVGAACADSLARRGLSVLVLDSRFAGGGVTAAGMGHIVVMDDSEAQFQLTSYSRKLWSDLAGELSRDCEDEPCGTLWIAENEEEWNAVRAKKTAYESHGVSVEVLDSRALAQAEPNLRPGLKGALRVPEDRVVYPPNAARWLLERAKNRGARVREGCEVIAANDTHVTLSNERLSAGQVVNAAGPEAPRLTQGLPIEPRKGHLVITDRYPGFCRHQLVELGYLKSAHVLTAGASSVAFNVQPRATGQFLIGSSREFVGWDSAPNPDILERMIRRGVEFMPALAALSALRVWTGFRPATPDKLPLIGRWRSPDTRRPGPWIAAGHEGLGITTATGTAEILAALMTGETPPIDPAPFDPNRRMPDTVH